VAGEPDSDDQTLPDGPSVRSGAGRPAPLEAVLIDALGTLVGLRPPGGRLAEVLSAGGLELTPREAEAAFAGEIVYYRAHHLRGRDEASLRALRLDCAGVLREGLPAHVREALSAEELLPAMLGSLRFSAFPEVEGALAELRRAGMRLVVVSNWDVSLHDVLTAAGLAGLFDGVLSSAEVGVAKPDRRPFRAALELAGSGPERAIHVGDSLAQDVAGARAAGIAPVLLRRDALSPSTRAAAGSEPVRPRGAALSRPPGWGTPAIASLTELPGLVAKRA
jgi:putative hydrolase of the HAD superfamily